MSTQAPRKSKRSNLTTEIVRQISHLFGKLIWCTKYNGIDNLPESPKGGLIIASNHQTYLDPFLIGAPIKFPLRFMAWDKPFQWFLFGRFLTALGAFPVSLNKGGTVRAMRESIEILKNDGALVIFPEASREFSDGQLLEFKTGAIRLARETGAQILPVTIKGGNKVWSRDHKFPRLGRIEIFYHPLLDVSRTEDSKDYSVASATKKLRKVISSI